MVLSQMAVVDEFLHDAAHLRLLHAIRGKRLGRLEHRAPHVACSTLLWKNLSTRSCASPPLGPSMARSSDSRDNFAAAAAAAAAS